MSRQEVPASDLKVGDTIEAPRVRGRSAGTATVTGTGAFDAKGEILSIQYRLPHDTVDSDHRMWVTLSTGRVIRIVGESA